MTLTKLIPTTIWNSLPELDLSSGENLFPQVDGDTYRPVRSDVTSVTVPALTPGAIAQSAPAIGDTLSVTGSNAPAGATYQWQRDGSDVPGATGVTLETTGLSAGNFRRAVSAGVQGPVYTAAVSVAAASSGLPAAFAPGDWSIADLGTGGDAALTITALPNLAAAPYADVIQLRINGGSFGPFAGGVNSPGTYNLNDLFTDGVAADVQLRVVTNNALFAGGAGPASDTKSVTTSASSGSPAPILDNVSFDDLTQDLQISAANGSGALTLAWATCNTNQSPSFTVAGGWTLSPYESGSAPVARDAETELAIPVSASTPDGQRRLRLCLYDAESQVSNILSVTFTADSTAPTVSSAATSPDGTQVVVTLSEDIAPGSTNPTAWDVQVNGASRGVSFVALSGNQIVLTLASAVLGGESASVAYTAGAITDLRRNPLASFSAIPVTNTVTGGGDLLALMPLQESNELTSTPSFTADLSAYGAGDRIVVALGTTQPASAATLGGAAMTLVSAASINQTGPKITTFEHVLSGPGSATTTIAGTLPSTSNRNFLAVIATRRAIGDAGVVRTRGATLSTSVTPGQSPNTLIGLATVETGGLGIDWSGGSLTEVEEATSSAASSEAFSLARIDDVALAANTVSCIPNSATGASNQDCSLVAFVLE